MEIGEIIPKGYMSHSELSLMHTLVLGGPSLIFTREKPILGKIFDWQLTIPKPGEIWKM